MKAFGTTASPRTVGGFRAPTTSNESLTPSPSQKRRPPRIPKENVDPSPAAEPSPYRSPAAYLKILSGKKRSPLPPRPPQPAAKKKLSLEIPSAAADHVGAPAASDSGVQVIVRIRPLSKEEDGADQVAGKISQNSISIGDHAFTFDSVADSQSTQEDIFRLVGLPLVDNCLSGFNSSIFAYGQTGSGKTYTMWGPQSALSDDASASDRGLTPRVFEQLFSRIEEEESKHANKQLNYQCRCSFLEIYNEQITDLLDPNRRSLQIREDVRTGVYVDCLTEEFVSTMKDVTQLLMKGLANRRIGATSINTESSRSHCVFTCIVESRSKSMDNGLISLRKSRINLVDLAGSERQKQTGAAGERLKEAGNINRSLSQLGNLINILAEVSQTGRQRHIPYRDSRLTFLLQESLGGNAKLAMICGISPSQSCKNETLSTLRFAQRAKAIKNTAVVNEVTEDDVNVLREQIRQLKDELLRMKSNGPTVNSGSFSTGWNARRSLSLLKMSLCRPTALSTVKDDSDEEMEIDENDVEMPCIQAPQLLASGEDRITSELTASKTNLRSSTSTKTLVLQNLESTENTQSFNVQCYVDDVKEIKTEREECDAAAPGTTENDASNHLDANHEAWKHNQKVSQLSQSHSLAKTNENALADNSQGSSDSQVCSLNIVSGQKSPVLQQPTLSTSPLVDSCIKRNLRTSAMSASHSNKMGDRKSGSGALDITLTETVQPLNLSKSCTKLVPSAQDLEASLQHGLRIINNQHCSSALRRSSFRFSIVSDVKPMRPVATVDFSMQTDQDFDKQDLSAYICSSCKKKMDDESKDVSGSTNLQLVPVEESISTDKLKIAVPKAVEKVLAGSIRREMALEDHCLKQHNEIMMLNRLVEQYKRERECNAIIAQTREEKISRLENLMDGILPAKDFMEEEFISLANEHKILKEKYENHPKVSQANIDTRRIQGELDNYKSFFDMGERDVLMEEIQDLRTQLQFYVDFSKSSQSLKPLLQLTHSPGTTLDPLDTVPETKDRTDDENVCPQRCSCAEKESKWFALSEKLRLELELSQSQAEKLKFELDSEKKCTEELKEALETAMQGHVRILEQYSELQEKHTALRAMNQRISEDIEDIKKAAAKAGVRGAESRFINALAAELSSIRAEREKEKQYWMNETRALQAQLQDTADAVQAAGELLVRLKDAEEAATMAERRALLAEQETEKACQEIDSLKKNYGRETALLNQSLAETHVIEEPFTGTNSNTFNDGGESPGDQRWTENEFEPFCIRGDTEFSKDTDPNSWFLGYDRCNI